MLFRHPADLSVLGELGEAIDREHAVQIAVDAGMVIVIIVEGKGRSRQGAIERAEGSVPVNLERRLILAPYRGGGDQTDLGLLQLPGERCVGNAVTGEFQRS